MILGLPKETKESFVHGMCELLESGNHDDIKVWELMMLPNAPMGAHVERYGLNSVRKNLFPELPNVPLDEVETKDVVVETDTMPFEDWVDSYAFAIMVQTLHCGYYTRWISKFCHDTHGISYEEFYTKLMLWTQCTPSVLGDAMSKIRSALIAYATGQTSSLWMKVDRRFGPRRCESFDWLWLEVNSKMRSFYAEICSFLNTGLDLLNPMFIDLIRYNEFRMLNWSDEHGSSGAFTWDWMGYFEGNDVFPTDNAQYTHYDTHTGIDNRYPLDYHNGAAFARAAIGDGFYLSRYNHYIHRNVSKY
jgi:hypothetical protein